MEMLFQIVIDNCKIYKLQISCFSVCLKWDKLLRIHAYQILIFFCRKIEVKQTEINLFFLKAIWK